MKILQLSAVLLSCIRAACHQSGKNKAATTDAGSAVPDHTMHSVQQAPGRSFGNKGNYPDIPDIRFQNWEKAYQGDNYPPSDVERRYDPGDLFHYWQNVRP